MADMKIYGYMRVSSKEQNEDRQRIALIEMGVPEKKIFIWINSQERILKECSIKNYCES